MTKELFKLVNIDADNYDAYIEHQILNGDNVFSKSDIGVMLKNWAFEQGYYILTGRIPEGWTYILLQGKREVQKHFYFHNEWDAIEHCCNLVSARVEQGL